MILLLNNQNSSNFFETAICRGWQFLTMTQDFPEYRPEVWKVGLREEHKAQTSFP